jgi:gamma-tubulin complex component 2
MKISSGESMGEVSIASDSLPTVRCFAITYSAPWPLPLLFTPIALSKYQLIFRHLLYCRYVERKLGEVWIFQQSRKELRLGGVVTLGHSLRQRMLHFCRSYVYYCCSEVLEPNWYAFVSQLHASKTVETLFRDHAAMLDTCLKETLLTDPQSGLLKYLSKVLSTCALFATNMQKFDTHRSYAVESSSLQRNARVAVETQSYLKIVGEEKYMAFVKKFEETFHAQLVQFLEQLLAQDRERHEPHLVNLVTRLDYNGFYLSSESRRSA